MTSDEIGKVCEMFDAAWPDKTSGAMSVETSIAAATWQTAYHLAILNEQIDGVLNSRIAQLRVMVEPGEYPINTQVQEQHKRW